LTVWNRTQTTAEQFVREHGGTLAQTPAEAASRAEVVFTMVVDGPQVEHVLLDDEIGAAGGAAGGTLFVDCSTIGPQYARAIGARLAERGLTLLDAPVTGSSPRAEDGTLTIMVGGDKPDFERVRPLLDLMGALVVHAGELGQGQIVKLINNAVAATNAAVLGQALLVGKRSNSDIDALCAVMGAGSGGSAMLALKAPAMRSHNYTTLFTVERSDSGDEIRTTLPYFKTEHMLKDIRLCLDHGQDIGAPFPFAALAREVFTMAVGLGHGEDDFASIIEALERAAGTRL
jgi:3-hydroxyisobutyrate dehydrogenase-like beta-hydroxyacid dehydrogenase